MLPILSEHYSNPKGSPPEVVNEGVSILENAIEADELDIFELETF